MSRLPQQVKKTKTTVMRTPCGTQTTTVTTVSSVPSVAAPPQRAIPRITVTPPTPGPSGIPGAASRLSRGASRAAQPMMQSTESKTVVTSPSGTRIKTFRRVEPVGAPCPAASQAPTGIPRRALPVPVARPQPQMQYLKPPRPHRPATSTPAVPPSALKKSVFQEALARSKAQPRTKVIATGQSTSKTSVPIVVTKRGPEPVVQQMTLEKVVQRSPKAEYISKYVRGVDVDQAGQAKQLEMTSQQIDPTHATETAGINETVSVTSTISITARGKQKSTQAKRKLLKAEGLDGQVNMNPHQVNRLIAEETEDVENTLRMVPPDLVAGAAPEKFPLKKKLQMLRLNSESMGLLEQHVVHPAPTADEVDSEAPPEVMATIVHAIEKGATPQSSPNQIFNTLFPEVQDQKMDVSPVAPGPLQDVVVPTDPPTEINDEVLNDEMEKTVLQAQNALEPPKDDIATENKITPPKRPSKAKKKKPVMIAEEIPPWGPEDVAVVSTLVGADPIFTLNPVDVGSVETPQQISVELSKGVDYFLEADTVPYVTKVQLRGSRPPAWFPGYVSAFPHLPDLIKVTRTPSTVLHTAWRAVQPKIFPEDSILIV